MLALVGAAVMECTSGLMNRTMRLSFEEYCFVTFLNSFELISQYNSSPTSNVSTTIPSTTPKSHNGESGCIESIRGGVPSNRTNNGPGGIVAITSGGIILSSSSSSSPPPTKEGDWDGCG